MGEDCSGKIPEDPECQLMQFLCTVGCQKKINIPVIVFGGQDMVGAAIILTQLPKPELTDGYIQGCAVR